MELFVVLFATVASVASGAKCRHSEARVSLTASQNQSGHWMLDVSLNSLSPGGPLKIDLHPQVQQCDSLRTSSVDVVVRGPGLPPPPDSAYELVPNMGYYKLNSTPVTWEEARNRCEEEGTHLLVLNSEEEASAVQKIIALFPSLHWFSIGFHNHQQDGHFVTIFGESLSNSGYTRWTPGEPNNSGGDEYCGSIYHTMGLNDQKCITPIPFICEQEI